MQYMTKNELRRLFGAAYEHDRNHHLVLVVGFWHGLRVSEILRIRGTDVFDGQLSVKRLKGSRATIQPLHIDTDTLFDEASGLTELASQTAGLLFDFSRQWADKFIRKYGQIGGIHPSKCHMHVLKHSLAMALWDATQSLGQIQSYLGHVAAASTLEYLREVEARKAQDAVSKITI